MPAVLIFVSLLVLVVNSHPICTSIIQQLREIVPDKACSDNITANVTFYNKWLDLSDDSKGIDQLRSRSTNTVASKLLNTSSTKHADCLENYARSVEVPYANDPSITTIRHYFNAYLMHKLYIEHLVKLNLPNLFERSWLSAQAAYDTYDGLTDLLNILEYNVKNLAQLLNTTCHGCTRNCSKSNEMAASLVSTMDHCNSPIYSVVFTITSHSEKLYKLVKELKDLADDQSNSNEEINNSQTFINDDVSNLCWCN